MMDDNPKHVETLADRSHAIHSWSLSEEIEDSEWNQYLEQHLCGQFQQSTFWANFKAADGWSVLRIKLLREGKLEGGAQLLYRKSRAGKIGYVAKGPVVSNDSDMKAMLARVQAVGRDRSLRALVIQAPDFWQGGSAVFLENGGQPERLMDVIQATLSVDLARPIEVIRSEMSTETRRQIKLAERQGIGIREGAESEIDLFFDLMLESCRRQQCDPNPASAQGLRDLWSAFRGRGCVRMTFAVAEGEVIAGLLSIVFGNRLTIWRKGWRDAYPGLNPNRFLYSETIEWGRQQGLRWCDFGSLNQAVADALIGGHAIPTEGVRGRDTFHLSFGGKPFLLPLPYIFFPKLPLRLAYRAGAASGVMGWLMRSLKEQ